MLSNGTSTAMSFVAIFALISSRLIVFANLNANSITAAVFVLFRVLWSRKHSKGVG